MDVIAEESKKIKDVAVSNSFNGFGAFFDKIVSIIGVGIFKSPPFSLENIFPSVDFFKNKYFKLVSMLVIYLGLMGFILKAFKPKTTEKMIIVYSVCFWIALMAFSIAVVNPYDESSVEYMLKDKVIKKIKEITNEKSETMDLKPSTSELPTETLDLKPSTPELPESTTTNPIKIPESNSTNEEKGFLENTIKSFL
jgi:hypothetical protein